jgi:hypothetical protein
MKFFIGEWYSDLAILECYMKSIEYKTGTNRLKKFGIPKNIGGSVTYGYVKFGYMSPTKNRKYCEKNDMYESVLLTERPELMEVFSEFRDIYFNDFNLTRFNSTITMHLVHTEIKAIVVIVYWFVVAIILVAIQL